MLAWIYRPVQDRPRVIQRALHERFDLGDFFGSERALTISLAPVRKCIEPDQLLDRLIRGMQEDAAKRIDAALRTHLER